jgi:thymidylate synthase (FAD)
MHLDIELGCIRLDHPSMLPSSSSSPASTDSNADSPSSTYAPSASSIRQVAPQSSFVDLMHGAARWEVVVHEHGLVALCDVMPRLVPAGQTADSAVVQAARVSYGAGTKHVSEDRGLIRYLARHRHTTPFEMVEFKFHCVMPVFVARQWIRHRTANVNEYSARYSIVKDRFYRPTIDNVRRQSMSNRQGGDEPIDAVTAQDFLDYLDESERLYDAYERLIEHGVSRELARIALPVSVYTEWYWKCDLHNTLRFLSLRLDAHAQQEIRDYAEAMLALIRPLAPIACEAFVDYDLESMHLSKLEIESIRSRAPMASDNKREQAEWEAKRERLGISTD